MTQPTQPEVTQVEPFGYWVEQKYAEPALLRKPSYIPEPSELRTVTPLYASPPSSVDRNAVLEGNNGLPVLLEWVVELEKRDIARTQTDFIGRMQQALASFEDVCDQYPDGDWPEDARDEGGEELAALAGLALAQLAMVVNPDDPASALRTTEAPAQEGE